MHNLTSNVVGHQWPMVVKGLKVLRKFIRFIFKYLRYIFSSHKVRQVGFVDRWIFASTSILQIELIILEYWRVAVLTDWPKRLYVRKFQSAVITWQRHVGLSIYRIILICGDPAVISLLKLLFLISNQSMTLSTLILYR